MREGLKRLGKVLFSALLTTLCYVVAYLLVKIVLFIAIGVL